MSTAARKSRKRQLRRLRNRLDVITAYVKEHRGDMRHQFYTERHIDEVELALHTLAFRNRAQRQPASRKPVRKRWGTSKEWSS